MTRLEIAELYDYSQRTLTRRMAANGIVLIPRQLIEIDAQLCIYARLGRPCKMKLGEWQVLRPILLKYCRQFELPEPPDW